MPQSKIGGAVAISLALALVGCQSDRFSPLPTRAPQPQPLSPAPSGTVNTSQLPPPSEPTGVDDFPDAPQEPGGSQMAAIDPDAAANAPDVTAGGVAGVWNVTVADQSCRVATPQTKFGQGYRAGPLRCPAPMDEVRSWNVSGKQLSFYDEDGNVLARLHSSGEGRFNGQTTTGVGVSLSR